MPKRKVLFVQEIVKQILQIVICYKLQKSSGQKRQKRPQQRCETCTETFGPLVEAFRPEDHLRPQERISHIYTKRDGRLDGTENLCAKSCVALIKTSWLCNFRGFVCMFVSWEGGGGEGHISGAYIYCTSLMRPMIIKFSLHQFCSPWWIQHIALMRCK